MSDTVAPEPQLHLAGEPHERIPVEELDLPPNLKSGMGGIDATGALFDPDSFHGGLFDFETDAAKRTREVAHWREGTTEQKAEFGVPNWLTFTWQPQDISMQVAGETKALFQHDLSMQIELGGSYGGFSGEFSRTFKGEDSQETFQKYAAHYERARVYSVAISGNPIARLSDDARDALAHAPVNELIDNYGTHYTHTAVMGGLEIYSAKIDVRDSVSKEDLKTAIKLKYDSDDGTAASGSVSTGDTTVEKLSRKMETSQRMRLGEGAGNRDEWIRGLNSDPDLIGYKLKPLSDLVPADKPERRAEVAAEIERRMANGHVSSNAQLLAMRVPLERHANDHMTGASKSLGVGRPHYYADWFFIGDWVQHDQNFPGGYEALVFQNPPRDADDKSPRAIESAKGFDMLWSAAGMALFRAEPQEGYTAVGDLFDENIDGATPSHAEYYGMVHDDLLVDSAWTDPGDPYWDNRPADMDMFGRSHRGAIFTFAAGEEHNKPDPTVWPPDGGVQVHMFKAFADFAPSGTPRRIDMSKVRVVEAKWLD